MLELRGMQSTHIIAITPRSTLAWSGNTMGSIPGQVIPKTQKMVLDATLPNTQHYKVTYQG